MGRSYIIGGEGTAGAKTVIFYILCLCIAIEIPFFLGMSLGIGVSFIAFLLAVVITLLCIGFPRFGFYFLIAYVFLICFFQRMVSEDFPIGVMPKLITLAILMGIFLKKIMHREKLFVNLNNPITYLYLAYSGFLLIEAFNPNISSLKGWVPLFVGNLFVFLFYIVSTYIFSTKKEVVFFLKFWLVLATLTAVYGCIQQWFGLPPWEYNRILSDPHTYALFFQNGFMRKYSFMADPPSFGILMSSTSLLAFCLALGKVKRAQRNVLIIIGVLMALSMSYSGTRMATALIPLGLLFYGMLTIQNKKTIIFLGISVMIVLVINFLPIYGNGVLVRVRSTFHPDEDASMQVRDLNRKSIQPYMHANPIGGGLGTAGGPGMENYPGHPLAGFEPDGTFMQTAIEQGWIGFLLFIIVLFFILRYGIRQFYLSRNSENKVIYSALLTAMFCWYMAQYTQIGISAFNIVYLYMPTLAILVQLRKFEHQP